jgi:hypothetical protein
MLPGTPHPWLGRLAPNLALSTGTGDTDLATLLAPGRGVLLDLAGNDDLRRSAGGWADRVEIATATCPGRATRDRPDEIITLTADGEEPARDAQPSRITRAAPRENASHAP